MTKPVSIYDAKTNLSKLIAQAKAGDPVVIGAYGKPEVMLIPYQPANRLNIGLLQHRKQPMDYSDIIAPDAEIQTEFDASTDEPLI
jgi:prevent-host-death family protein